jgi:quercetin dioxygenase-like cupin family protein
MSSVSAAKSMTNALSAAIVASDKLPRTKVWGGAFAVYGGNGTTASSAIVYEVEPGKRLGWHTDATEETQYIIAGSGKLYLEDGTAHQVSRRRCSRKTLTR